jgi:hypothetical protein
MKRFLYGTLTRDRLAYMIHHAQVVAVYDPGSRASLWEWNNGVPEAHGEGAVRLEIEIASEQELGELKALVLQIKGS